jgi:CHAD domain-containing protein
MGYGFDRNEPVPDAVRRITDEQVEAAVAGLERVQDHDLEATVHDCRKRAKKLRGLLRLVRPALGSAYGPANKSFRDAGRELSAIRDAHAALATFDALVAASLDRLPEGGLGALRVGLAAAADRASNARDRRVRVEVAADLFRAGRRQVGAARLDARGWAAVGPGIERTYRAGRGALAAAHLDRGSDPTAMHEWRKRTKDAWYHVRLLSDAAPSILEPLEARFHDLSDALGDAHDLAVICERLSAAPNRFGGRTPVRGACALAEERRGQLERRAARLGVRLYAEKPRAYNDRMGAYWRLWQDSGAEKAVGGLTDLFPPADGLDALDLEQLRDRAGEAALPARLHPAKADLIGELRAAGAG